MGRLQVVLSREVLGKEFRIYGDYENPLFLARDVAAWIEHSNTIVMLQSVDAEEKVVNNVYTLGGEQKAWFLTENGLYEVLMQSRKPIAKEFKKKVKEILKSVRKTGGYIATTPEMTDAEIMAKALLVAQNTIQEREKRIGELTEENRVMQPKALFADSVAASENTILIYDLAKLLRQNGVDIGGTRLFRWMRDNGYLVRRKGTDYNMPTQKSMDMGLFRVKETTHAHSDGHISITRTPKVTGKGQVYFVNKFLNKD